MISKLVTSSSLVMVGRALLFGATILLARYMSPETYGIYAFALTLIAFLSVPTQSGLPELVTREVARRLAPNGSGHVRDVGHASAMLVLQNIVLVLFILAILVVPLDRYASAFEMTLLPFIALSIPMFAIQGVGGGFVRGTGHVSLALVPREFFLPGTLVILLLLVQPAQAATATSLYASAITVSAIATIAILYWKWPRCEAEEENPVSRYGLLKAAIPFSAIAILSLVVQRVDIIILGFLVEAGPIGIFNLASQLALIAALPLAIFNGVAAPQIARLHVMNDHLGLQRLMLLSSAALMGVAMLGIGVFYLIGRPVIVAVFGEQYSGAYELCLILLIGQAVNLACGPVGMFLNICGFEKRTLTGLALAAFTAIVLNLLLIPLLGVYGAAISTLISVVIWNAYLSYQVYRRLGLWPSILGAVRYRKGIIDR